VITCAPSERKTVPVRATPAVVAALLGLAIAVSPVWAWQTVLLSVLALVSACERAVRVVFAASAGRYTGAVVQGLLAGTFAISGVAVLTMDVSHSGRPAVVALWWMASAVMVMAGATMGSYAVRLVRAARRVGRQAANAA
jgi:MFS family permease